MVTLITVAHLFFATDIYCSPANGEFDNLLSSEIPDYCETNDWSTWLNDEKRMTWWQKNGWRILDGQKQGVFAGSIQMSRPMSETWSPMDIGLVPDEITHLAYALDEDKTLVLFSLQRCETLYLRSLLAKRTNT